MKINFTYADDERELETNYTITITRKDRKPVELKEAFSIISIYAEALDNDDREAAIAEWNELKRLSESLGRKPRISDLPTTLQEKYFGKGIYE